MKFGRKVVRRLVLTLAATTGVVVAADSMRTVSSPLVSHVRSISSWPWLPGGILYKPAKFGVVPYSVLRKKDANVPKGQSLLVAPGEPGFSYGIEGMKRVVAAPKAERIVVGTAPVHDITIAGKTYAYDRVMTMMTTAYNGSYSMNGPAGAVAAWNGEPLTVGDVAVDPTVIPLGTYLYVTGYGFARAVDTGSDIAGDHIDLFFNESNQQVGAYGIQYKKVYVLGPVSPTPIAPKLATG